MKNIKLQQISTFFFTLLFSAVTWAVPPAGSPYITDTTNMYVQDATSQGIGNVNMVLCIMNAMNISGSGMLNKGSYVALIDVNKCQPQGSGGGGSSSSSGASSATNFMTAVVNATRADNSSPMVAGVWMSLTQQGQSQDIYVRISATSSPTDVPPYGVFRMDFLGKMKPSGVQQMNGFINSSASTLQYYEVDAPQGNGNQGNLSALSMTAGSTTSGSGTMLATTYQNNTPTTSTFNFNYNPNYFLRSDGSTNLASNNQCFDRALANADKSVWQYGTYDATLGTRIDLTHPGFPVNATYSGTSYYGYASYYGINFQGLTLPTTGSTTPITGLVVSDQRPGNSTTYNLSVVGGKLTKWTQNTTTLGAMDGIPFSFFGDMTGQTTGNTNAVNAAITTAGNGYQNWQVQWNSTGANFTVIGMQVCSNNGCNNSTFANPVVVTGTSFNTAAISGWSNSFGGNVTIPPNNGNTAHAAGDIVAYYSQSNVVPSSAAALTLYCLSNCPDATSINTANANTTGGAASPYNLITASQWFNSSTSTTVSYTFGATGLVNGGVPMTITNATYLSSNPMYSNGLQTGNLFTTPLAACTNGMPGVCEPSNPSVYYTWQTGTNQWSQSMWLTNASTNAVVTFDPPQNISYTVPASSVPSTGPASTWANKTILLQFDGFGNIQGIPGYCVDANNAVVDCTTSSVRYVPEFAIPDAATMTLNTTQLIVKALNEEVRFKNLGASAAQCSAMTLAAQTLPTASGLHDMSLSTDTFYIGTKPTPASSTPKVIDGVVQ